VKILAHVGRLVDGEFERPRNGKKDDKAHPPIHPTAHGGTLEADERRVFELIARRFLASCHSNAKGNTTTVEVEIASEIFSTTGKSILRVVKREGHSGVSGRC
jgi:DNA topoisomerase-3